MNNYFNNYVNSIRDNVNKECMRLQEQEIQFKKLTGMEINTALDLFLSGYWLMRPDIKNIIDFASKNNILNK